MQRLKTREQFQAVLAGPVLARTAHFSMHSAVSDAATDLALQPSLQKRWPFSGDDRHWIGAMVPKRWARRAVTRNLIKRQIYNVAEIFESSLPRAAYVVRLRAAFDRSHFISAASDQLKKSVRAEVEQLFKRCANAQNKVAER